MQITRNEYGKLPSTDTVRHIVDDLKETGCPGSVVILVSRATDDLSGSCDESLSIVSSSINAWIDTP